MTTANPTIRTRFAPSPTGKQHIGGFRTALYSYLYAKRQGGVFILRIEDTDQTRYVEGSIESIYSGLEWLGMKPDEGPREGGDYGPYTQSERLSTYKKFVQQLLEQKKAYKCFCTQERLTELKEVQSAAGKPPKYDRKCLTITAQEMAQKNAAGETYVIRQKMPDEETLMTFDELRGKTVWQTKDLDDHVLMKSDGFPTYHLANVVDDHLMKITHVFRGEEWLPSFPKHVALYNAFTWTMPKFIHLPLLLAKEGGKLSKRKGAVPLADMQGQGLLPEAVVNFMAFLGWNPKTEQEIFSMEQLIEKFSLKGLNKAGAIYDTEKLDWYNGYYIHNAPVEKLLPQVKKFLPTGHSDDFYRRVITIEKNRLTRLDQIQELSDYLFTKKLNIDVSILPWKETSTQETSQALEFSRDVLEKIGENAWEKLENIEKTLKEDIKTNQQKNGPILWPLRVALTGKAKSPSPFEVAWVLGKKTTLQRIEWAIQQVQK